MQVWRNPCSGTFRTPCAVHSTVHMRVRLRGSARGSEDVPLRVNGSAGSAAAGLSLPMVFRQRVQRSTRQGHRPGGAAGLGWQFAQLPFDPLHGLLDTQRPSAEVDVVPSQTAHLAAA